MSHLQSINAHILVAFEYAVTEAMYYHFEEQKYYKVRLGKITIKG